MGATRGLPYIYLIQKITQNYLWQRGKGLNQIVCNFDSTFAVRLWQNQLENSVTKRSCIRHQLDCLNKKSQTLWCDTTCNRKRHFLSHQKFNGLYKISRESSVRETNYVKCNRMRARARSKAMWLNSVLLYTGAVWGCGMGWMRWMRRWLGLAHEGAGGGCLWQR